MRVLDYIFPLCLFSLLIVAIVCGWFGVFPHYSEAELITNTPIFTLHTDTALEGSFFLGSGSINSYTQYIFYSKVGDTKGMVLSHIPTDDTIVYMDENVSPYVKRIDWVRYNTKTNEIDTYEYIRVTGNGDWIRYPKYELHVPNGTIIQEYKL